MQQELKDKWIAALLSGNYTQGKHLLVNSDSEDKKTHCCLGVLCEIAGLSPTEDPESMGSIGYTLGNENENGSLVVWTDVLSDEMLEKFDLRPSEQLKLAHMNDGEEGEKEHSFEQIAEYIKNNL